jgi:hypothetical protein
MSSVRVPLIMTNTPEAPPPPSPAKEPTPARPRPVSGAEKAELDPRVREAMLSIVREIDRMLAEGPVPTTESRLRMWLATPGLRALLYPTGSVRDDSDLKEES